MKTVTGANRKTYFRQTGNDRADTFCKDLLQLSDPDEFTRQAAVFREYCSCKLHDFPKVDGGYSRTIICRLDNGFEAMVARWSHGAKTLAHGHPGFGYYHLLEGCWLVENFIKTANGIEKVSEQIWQADDHCTITGVHGHFDNGIHRIHSLKESLSFHVYSDDALKGECFQ